MLMSDAEYERATRSGSEKEENAKSEPAVIMTRTETRKVIHGPVAVLDRSIVILFSG